MSWGMQTERPYSEGKVKLEILGMSSFLGKVLKIDFEVLSRD